MSEKPAAGILTAVLAVPLVLLCCLGPAAVGSLFAGAGAWLGGLSVAAATAAAIAGALCVYGFLRWRKARHHHEGA